MLLARDDDAQEAHVLKYDALYIDGDWVAPLQNGGTADVLSAADGSVIGHVPVGSAADVDRAVAAARKAFGR